MKRVTCLLLCFLMLFCCACNREPELTVEPPNEHPAMGVRADSFYTADGNIYNIYVSMMITTEELIAPVTTLSIELKNDSDYVIMIQGDPDKCFFEKWVNGKWKSFGALSSVGENREEIDISSPISPHSSYIRTDDFSKHPLEAGVYRLRIKYNLTNDKEVLLTGNYSIIQSPCMAEVYFAIAPEPAQ